MPTYIALLRGINVGGKHILKMADLRTLLTDLGFANVQTYIQSGNVVFQSDNIPNAEAIQNAIDAHAGFTPQIMILTTEALQHAAQENPYPTDDPKAVHLYFLESTPSAPDTDLLDNLKADSEAYQLGEGVFYLYAPEGIGRSKLVEKVEKALGVNATARNWRTVSQLLGML